MNRILSAFLLAIVMTISIGANAWAQESDPFSSCITASGRVVADYPNGEHGIVGEGSRIGQDKVYALSENNAMQCFCANNGNGIQTNWLYAANFSEEQIKVYESQGWIYVPDGTAWGLSEGAYLAKNTNYTCSGSSTTQGSSGDGRTDGLTDGRSDGLGSIVQSATGTNLASTGNIVFVSEVFLTGVVMILIGLFLRKKVN